MGNSQLAPHAPFRLGEGGGREATGSPEPHIGTFYSVSFSSEPYHLGTYCVGVHSPGVLLKGIPFAPDISANPTLNTGLAPGGHSLEAGSPFTHS